MMTISDIDHEWFGSWMDAGPGKYDQLKDDSARLSFVLSRTHGYRSAMENIAGELE